MNPNTYEESKRQSQTSANTNISKGFCLGSVWKMYLLIKQYQWNGSGRLNN